MRNIARTRLSAIAVLIFAALLARAQFVDTGDKGRAGSKTNAVVYLFPEQVTVHAGKPSPVNLHFRVGTGLHINSHTPSEKFLIATAFSIAGNDGVELASASYPAGETITLASDPGTRLSVYTGEFVIHAQIVSVAGNHLAQGKLHYQACDRNECMPPKTITVPIDVIAQ
ncbi:MAG: protein-disulfide reductase DsbD domain-containing protein [Terracidiphilus sp.]